MIDRWEVGTVEVTLFQHLSENFVAPEIDQFWNLVADSQLLGDEQYRAVRDGCQAPDSTSAADGLLEKKLISDLQREVLLAGHAGPFFYGRYVVMSRLKLSSDPAGFHSFVAADRKTGYRVRLQFFDGQLPGALKAWAEIEQQACVESDKLTPGTLRSSSLEIYQAIALPDTRFVVRELPRGKTLATAVPLKSRLGAEQAAEIMTQVAAVFSNSANNLETQNGHMKDAPRLRMPVDPESLMNRLWLTPGKAVRFDRMLLNDSTSTDEATSTDDKQRQAFLLGALLLRLVGGRQLRWKWNQKSRWFKFDMQQRDALIAKLEDQPELVALLQGALCGTADAAISVEEFTKRIGRISGLELTDVESSKPRSAFLHSLRTLALPLGKPLYAGVAFDAEPIPEIDTTVAVTQMLDSFSNGQHVADDGRVQAAREAAVKRHQNRWMMPAGIAGGLLAAGLCLIGWAFWADGNSVRIVRQKLPVEKSIEQLENEMPQLTSAEPTAIDYTLVSYVQTLVEDGEATLWESPTTGLAIDFSWLPIGTEILFHLRGKEMLEQPGGERLLTSLGPDFAKMKATFEQQTGLAIAEMETLTVALVPDENRGYKSFFQVAVSDKTQEQLVAAWGQPDEVTLPGNRKLFAAADSAWCFVNLPEQQQPMAGEQTAESIDLGQQSLRFVMGEPRVVQQVVQDGGAVVLADALERLVRKTDRQRHFTLLTLSGALVNENAKGMWGQWSDQLLPPLRLALPDEVRAFSVSLHIDDGEYVEFNIDHSAGISAGDLAGKLQQSMRQTLTKVENFSQSLAKTEYWQQLQERFGLMLQDVTTALRWDTEFDQLIGNAWLAPNATQNLLSASELTMTFSESVEAFEQKSIPSSIEELLAMKRSLNVANPPDLNVLLSEVRAEIVDDFPELGFPFKIKLMGGDLQKEGITQNQRPGPLAIVEQPLSAILTQIMTSANPDKTISGPADPNCKLVWVVAQDPDEMANKAVLITTRAAAKEKGYSLPGVFVEK